MKRIIIFFVIFIFSALVMNTYAQEQNETKKLPIPRIGADPQNPLRDIGLDEVLTKYIGKRSIPIKMGSGSGKYSEVVLTSGAGLIVSSDYKKFDKVTKFTIHWCGNSGETLKGKKGISLYIPTDSLEWIVSGRELQKIRSSNFGDEKLSKLIELIERIFDDGGEMESIGDGVTALNEKVDNMQGDITFIRTFLEFGNENKKENGGKVESSNTWLWVLGTAAVITLGILTYKLVQQKDNGGTTIIVNPPTTTPPTGGPANPNNSVVPAGGFGLSFGVRF